MIEIYLLEQLVGLSRYKTLSEAAEHLHVTQPTLTRSIRKLEELLGAELFRREKNRIYINENGQLAVEYAKKILESEKEMINAIQALERSRHTISIGSCAPVPNILLTAELEKHFPDSQITSEIQSEQDLLDGLRQDTFQIITLNHAVSDKDFCCRMIGVEQLRISVMPAHPAAVLKSVSFADINGGTFLTYKNIGVWLAISRENMPNTRFIFQDGMDEYLEVVRSSSLPTFDTDLGNMIFGKSPNRVSVPISDDSAHMTYYAVYSLKNQNRFNKIIKKLADDLLCQSSK